MDIETLERATLAAVPPQRQETWQGWLLAFDDGTVGRCHSAVPLQHAPPQPGTLEHIAARYANAGLPCVLRVPQQPDFEAFRAELGATGYQASKPTLVQTAAMAPAPPAPRIPVQLSQLPFPEWEAAFLGQGADPVDGASRIQILRRARGSVFAAVREDGEIVAVGSACLHGGVCGIHGMRTLPGFRGRGHASAILAAFARMARERGVTAWFLQVEENNAAARRLYGRWGFDTAWAYAYWRRGQSGH